MSLIEILLLADHRLQSHNLIELTRHQNQTPQSLVTMVFYVLNDTALRWRSLQKPIACAKNKCILKRMNHSTTRPRQTETLLHPPPQRHWPHLQVQDFFYNFSLVSSWKFPSNENLYHLNILQERPSITFISTDPSKTSLLPKSKVEKRMHPSLWPNSPPLSDKWNGGNMNYPQSSLSTLWNAYPIQLYWKCYPVWAATLIVPLWKKSTL